MKWEIIAPGRRRHNQGGGNSPHSRAPGTSLNHQGVKQKRWGAEQKAARSAQMREYHANLTPEEKAERAAKISRISSALK